MQIYTVRYNYPNYNFTLLYKTGLYITFGVYLRNRQHEQHSKHYFR